MEAPPKYSKGSVILIPFPFSDLSQNKMRPAFVVADVGKDDYVLSQVTSNPYGDTHSIKIEKEDFEGAEFLQKTSYIRPGKLFTANSQIFVKKIGKLKEKTKIKVIKTIIDLIQNEI
ncbi:MAG: type II toxin-antitoxin system PemK/MazF family toxin [Deltaproteobacteria bacterium]|nr:MAG: type II toxin-antitoxin system PemK/MazF family toxin [Deltaproteobacteria bacterium]